MAAIADAFPDLLERPHGQRALASALSPAEKSATVRRASAHMSACLAFCLGVCLPGCLGVCLASSLGVCLASCRGVCLALASAPLVHLLAKLAGSCCFHPQHSPRHSRRDAATVERTRAGARSSAGRAVEAPGWQPRSARRALAPHRASEPARRSERAQAGCRHPMELLHQWRRVSWRRQQRPRRRRCAARAELARVHWCAARPAVPRTPFAKQWQTSP